MTQPAPPPQPARTAGRGGGRAVALAATVATAAAYLALVVCALLGAPRAALAALVVALLGEVAIRRLAPLTTWALQVATLPPVWRQLLVSSALLTLAVRTSADDSVVGWLLVASVVTGVAAGGLDVAATAVAHLRKSPLLSRNLPLPNVSIPASPRLLLTCRGWLAMPVYAVAALAAALTVAGLLPAGAGVAILVVSVVAALALLAWALAQVARARSADLRTRVPAAVQAAISGLSPDVVLYFGGRAEALYQVEMWLEALERSQHRVLVILRDTAAWRALRPTTLPVVCAPADTVVTELDLPSVRAALYVANGARNIHLLRKGGMRSAFIGHGDSDKASSRNPFAKVYDEIWVAGPAGARRYADAGAQWDDAIREVGWPGLRQPVTVAREDRPATVVYAPTWEGWGDDSTHSSVPRQGVALVEALLGMPGVRLVYRPHPLVGTRDPRTRRAHEEILERLRQAGAPSPVAPPADDQRLDAVDLMRGRAVGRPGGDPAEDFWSALPGTTPGVALGDWPGLASVLDHADVLVSDVSGVLSDWIARDRPLAVTNPTGLTAQEYAARFPSSRAGLVLSDDTAELTAFVEGVLRGDDPTAAARGQVRRDLLGPDDRGPRSFEAALDRIVAEGHAPAAGATAQDGDAD